MKILMLSWEYPPKNVGGLSTHVYNISHALSKEGNEVHVITCEEGTAPVEENDNGVWVHRVTPYKLETEDFTKWIMQLNFAMLEEGVRLIKKIGKVDIIHAHDWLAAYSAKALKWAFNIPMVCTIHATENGRNGGVTTEMQRYISSTEWMLTYEAWKVVACSNYMRNQIKDTFSSPDDKIWVIPNGVDTKEFDFEFDWLSFRRKYAEDDEKIIFFLGRHVFEKGAQLIIEAAPSIVQGYNRTKFIIAGQGPMTEELEQRVKELGLQDKFVFPGYINEEIRNKLYRVSNVAVFPSLYEPFGIVALEAMAAGCPIVASGTGGLNELIKHGVNGLKMINGLSESLKDNVLKLLYDEQLADYIKTNAKKEVSEKYTWDKVAKMTMRMYNLIKEETKDTRWAVEDEESENISNNKLDETAFEKLEEKKENSNKSEAKKAVTNKKEEKKKKVVSKKVAEKQTKSKKVQTKKTSSNKSEEKQVKPKKEETKKTISDKAEEKEKKSRKIQTKKAKTKKAETKENETKVVRKRRGRKKKEELVKKDEDK